MNLPEVCIRRPVMTVLVMLSAVVAGIAGYNQLPVAAVPNIDTPTIEVAAFLPGAGAETMATSVATPIERQLTSIAGIDSIQSSSVEGQTQIVVTFDLDRNIDAAAMDVQARLSAIASRLPSDMPSPPTVAKNNPADSPVVSVAMSSETLPLSTLNDFAENFVAPRLSTIPGVSEIRFFGPQKYAVRIQLDPNAMAAFGLAMEDVQRVVAAANSNKPLGALESAKQSMSIEAGNGLRDAAQFGALVVATRGDRQVRLRDIAKVYDGVENERLGSWFNGVRSVGMGVQRQPGSNLVDVVEGVRALVPEIERQLPGSVKMAVAMDRSLAIKASVGEVRFTLSLTIGLVMLVIFLFLRNAKATAIPAMALPVALLGTFGGMYLMDYSINNLTLLALILSVGFVVDDAIVMLENIVRHVEHGESPMNAAFRGAREIFPTIVSITCALVAVFIPVLFMGGIVGRLFREFAVTISITIVISALVSLTLTPMAASRMLRRSDYDETTIGPEDHRRRHPIAHWFGEAFERLQTLYRVTLDAVLRRPAPVMGVLAVCVVLTVSLAMSIPKGFFPAEDNGFIIGGTEGPQDISYQEMAELQRQAAEIALTDPDVVIVNSMVGSNGGTNAANTGRIFLALRDFDERTASASEVIERLRPKLASIPGLALFLRPIPNIMTGGRAPKSQYQYSLLGTEFSELQDAALAVEARMRADPMFLDVTSDLQLNRPQANIAIDLDRAAALGVNADRIRDSLYGAFGTRQISTIYTTANNYRVIQEVAPEFRQDVNALSRLYVRSSSGQLVPLSAVSTVTRDAGPLSINHQAQLPSVGVSFSLPMGVALGDATKRIEQIAAETGLPDSVNGTFVGSAQVFQDSLEGQGLLLLAAIFAIYVVLGILYESWIHPLTLLSGLPAAGLGALLTLMAVRMDLNVISMIGVVMLIGIVMKNGIMMLDFAIERRRAGAPAVDAIREACLIRFRPIMMT
ncbi:MAG: efflux RND transporter permease subunit, partial [Rhodobacteraceae bacterium]|nr:efflux RND transporter permease subunit [Paracoccaceae bacterium]